jgi:hypothetical protein
MPAALVNMMGDIVHGCTLARTPRQLFEGDLYLGMRTR